MARKRKKKSQAQFEEIDIPLDSLETVEIDLESELQSPTTQEPEGFQLIAEEHDEVCNYYTRGSHNQIEEYGGIHAIVGELFPREYAVVTHSGLKKILATHNITSGITFLGHAPNFGIDMKIGFLAHYDLMEEGGRISGTNMQSSYERLLHTLDDLIPSIIRRSIYFNVRIIGGHDGSASQSMVKFLQSRINESRPYTMNLIEQEIGGSKDIVRSAAIDILTGQTYRYNHDANPFRRSKYEYDELLRRYKGLRTGATRHVF